jgi:hypothetical protein
MLEDVLISHNVMFSFHREGRRLLAA